MKPENLKTQTVKHKYEIVFDVIYPHSDETRRFRQLITAESVPAAFRTLAQDYDIVPTRFGVSVNAKIRDISESDEFQRSFNAMNRGGTSTIGDLFRLCAMEASLEKF